MSGVNVDEIPLVKSESNFSSGLRMMTALSLVVCVCFLLLIALNKKNKNFVYDWGFVKQMESDSVENSDVLNISYKENKEKKYRSFVVGRGITIHSPNKYMVIDHIMPRLSGVAKGMKGYENDFGFAINGGYSGNIGFEEEPLMTVTRGSGTSYSLDFGREVPIAGIMVFCEKPQNQQILQSAKVIIKDDDGKKVWQSCHFLKPQRLNMFKVWRD